MAGVLGFEPRMGDSESPALPLGDTPKRDYRYERTDSRENNKCRKRDGFYRKSHFLQEIFRPFGFSLFPFRRLEHLRIEESFKCSKRESSTSKYRDHANEDDRIHGTTEVLLCPSPVSGDIMYLIAVSHSRYTESDKYEAEKKIHNEWETYVLLHMVR